MIASIGGPLLFAATTQNIPMARGTLTLEGICSTVHQVVREKHKAEFSVGEFWNSLTYGSDGKLEYNQDKPRQEIAGWIHNAGGQVTAFDFTTKGILQFALENRELWRLKDSNGGPPGLIGLSPRNSVTFIDNHDTDPGIGSNPTVLHILAADADLYVASIDDKIITKIGPRYEVGNLVPPVYKVSTSGKDYAVWEKKA
ncbi:hypothetical protein M0R45_007787 [Rubus argutus]|uniref:alpha-amylase n=1 Tax=Rubus argutus TaxID=59490 RepID=A0AAW1XZB3_RUBAR